MEENQADIETFQDWFKSQTRYKTQKDFANATGIPQSSMGFYLRGKRKPLDEHREILYEVTGLECFKSKIKIFEGREEKKTRNKRERRRNRISFTSPITKLV